MATILIVDDEASVRKLLRLILAEGGHDVIAAGSGPEALRILQGRSVDLVITDIIMPDMDGLELIKAIKRLVPRKKLLAVSGAGKDGPGLYLELAAMLGADHILPKPFDAGEMRAAAAALIQQNAGIVNGGCDEAKENSRL
jgi:CheY-like chemotaxis protein